jgi:N-acetylmuramoyl-L-alanine amidase
MEIKRRIMTESDCYKAGRKITPKGIMVHSTAVPGLMAAAWFSRWNKPGIKACVHAFLDDKEIWQYLDWNHRGWHAGGSANNTHIGFEICEPGGHRYERGSTMLNYDVSANEEYFNKIYNNAIELCVMLCRQYGLTEKDIITHSEGYRLGVASNHGDVMHWFPKHGKSMDTFRKAVKEALSSQQGTAPAPEAEKKPQSEPVIEEVHIVQKGDTLTAIAREYNTTVQTLVNLNNISNPNLILVGQRVTLPQVKGYTNTDAKESVKVGAKVRVTGSRYATGQLIPSWVKNNTYTVMEVSRDGSRVLLREIMSWVYIKDVVLL